MQVLHNKEDEEMNKSRLSGMATMNMVRDYWKFGSKIGNYNI